MSEGCDAEMFGDEQRRGQERAGNEGQQIPDSYNFHKESLRSKQANNYFSNDWWSS